MTYPLENLGPHRFQQLCQSLLAKAFPHLQCFPVSAPDGGRDATIDLSDGSTEECILYQVKFTKNALQEKSPHKSVVNSLKSEIPNLSPQVLGKVKKYVLITNVQGTGQSETGSIDVVQELLNKELTVPSQCWWRDDLERRLDDAWDIKWAFPEVLRNFDILRIIVQQSLSEDAVRRTDTIRVFLSEQFEIDSDVRFKQVDLQNKLLDLFVDVPINLEEYPQVLRRNPNDYRLLLDIANPRRVNRRGRRFDLGVAQLLLNPMAQEKLPWVVVEGAPGQGKSTILQYICQVHRHRLLASGAIDKGMESAHRDVPLRLPFKVDCRDFSVWLGGKDPFLSEEQRRTRNITHRTLETFLSAQVEYYSGGLDFSVRDLQAVIGSSAILIVFDGLDEVADIRERRTVVDEITKGTRRIRQLSVSLQCVVTSRPTAFSNSPGLSRSQFLYLQLGSIDKGTILDYTNKWTRARGLRGADELAVRKILREKLDQPHLRDLARNPMQLTILLSLVHTKGSSLPDQRTALYDNYISLFFDREAEKSAIVRDQRELLVQIHRYLAWILHTEAQTEKTGGKIETARLKELVQEFLQHGRYDVQLAQALFSGVVDRVVALVSRIEGSYEFEVQPMREYFVARYLYDTAPYSPVGDSKPGTLPERFDALSRDFFWQNVTRFYAGSYSQGELPSLLESLVALTKSDEYGKSCYPRSLANTLLADYTFSQFPRIVDQVVDFILDERRFRTLVAAEHNPGPGEPWYLPKGNGRKRLVAKCFQELTKFPEEDYAQVLVEVIRSNGDIDDRRAQWWNIRNSLTGSRLTRWISYGISLGTLVQCDDAVLDGLLQDDTELDHRLTLLAFGGLVQYIASDKQRLDSVVHRILDQSNDLQFIRSGGLLSRFSVALSAQKYSIAFSESASVSLAQMWRSHAVYFPPQEEDSEESWKCDDPLWSKCREYVELSEELVQTQSRLTWASDLEPWILLTEHGRRLFGDRWAFSVLANAAAGIRDHRARCGEAGDLFDEAVPIVRRARHARLRAGQWRWWDGKLRDARSEHDLAFVLLLLFTWAGVSVFGNLRQMIDQSLNSLSDVWWDKIFTALDDRAAVRNGSQYWNISDVIERDLVSDRCVVALSRRLRERSRKELFQRRLCHYSGGDPSILNYCQEAAMISAFRDGPKAWDRWLPIISKFYRKGAVSSISWRPWMIDPRSYRIPVTTARQILEDDRSYPIAFLRGAEQRLRTELGERVVPVGIVAKKGHWFEE